MRDTISSSWYPKLDRIAFTTFVNPCTSVLVELYMSKHTKPKQGTRQRKSHENYVMQRHRLAFNTSWILSHLCALDTRSNSFGAHKFERKTRTVWFVCIVSWVFLVERIFVPEVDQHTGRRNDCNMRTLEFFRFVLLLF